MTQLIFEGSSEGHLHSEEMWCERVLRITLKCNIYRYMYIKQSIAIAILRSPPSVKHSLVLCSEMQKAITCWIERGQMSKDEITGQQKPVGSQEGRDTEWVPIRAGHRGGKQAFHNTSETRARWKEAQVTLLIRGEMAQDGETVGFMFIFRLWERETHHEYGTDCSPQSEALK